MNKTIRAKIIGCVQGVTFREFVRNQANKIGLTGYVKNIDDGSVEIFVTGEDLALNKLMKHCWKGPKMAKVDDIDINILDTTETYQDFSIKY